jgi:hypothetical protein
LGKIPSKEPSKRGKIELKEKEVAATLLAEENRIMTADLSKMDPGTRAWFEKRQRLILSRDD